jgi:hypothetical protein
VHIRIADCGTKDNPANELLDGLQTNDPRQLSTMLAQLKFLYLSSGNCP